MNDPLGRYGDEQQGLSSQSAQFIDWHSPNRLKQIRKRQRRERIFRASGQAAILLAVGVLALIISAIAVRGIPGLFQTQISVDIHLDQSLILANTDQPAELFEQNLARTNMQRLLAKSLDELFPSVTSRSNKRLLLRMFSGGTRSEIRAFILNNPKMIGQTVTLNLLASDEFDQLAKGNVDTSQPERNRRVSNQTVSWYSQLKNDGRISIEFYPAFFTGTDSRNPEQAGIKSALVGSLFTLFVTLLIAFPLAVMSAIYLEEFAPKNKLVDFIEININNLAAVPSIVFGLLGLAVFLGIFGMPRSAPLVGGLTLALMTLPTFIITARTAIRAVPSSIREAAAGVGASPMQVVLHHIIPLAMPGILTGAILGMARALGETAPLLMVGMVAFVADVPQSVTDASTVLPVQIFLWADSPERAFQEKTAAAILVLLFFLIVMNSVSIWLRQLFEKRW